MKAVEVKAEEPKKVEEKKEMAAKKAEVKETVKKEAPVKAAAEKKAPAKKAAAPKAAAEKKAPAKKAEAKKAETSISVQFAGKNYTTEDFVKSAQDVWQYDLHNAVADIKTMELYVKPEESVVYFVINGVAGSFQI
ncbi:MAG: hypothetical protein J6M46_02950 [Lachnospiraceae bacterium]|nr:hypothetical protein [Lachnospiraceae bacterium]